MRLVPELVFVNCCHLGRINSTPPHLLAANLATQFIRGGVRAVVAAGWAVEDSAALSFSDTFYEEMFAGSTFGDAVFRARQKTFGGSLGDGADLEAGLGDFGIDSDEPTFKVFGGVGIGRILAVEAAWHDLGNVTCCSQIADAGFDVDVQGVSVNVLAGFVISKLRLFVKGGLMSWEVDGRLESLAGPIPFAIDGEDAMGGVGASLNITRKIAVRAEWELFKIADDDLSIVSAGVTYRLW